jgi:hypothetical protein
MGNNSHTKPIVTRKLIALLKKHSFYNKKASKHGKYTRDTDEHTIMVPRDKQISPGLSQQIRKELIELHGFQEKDLRKLS